MNHASSSSSWDRLKNQAIATGLIAPSILSADFSDLRSEISEVEAAGTEWLHVDVMDGHFVPNLTIGPVVVKSLRPKTKSVLDCHLMVTRPEDWIEPFAKAGADCITIHAEASKDLDGLLKAIRGKGCKAGVSINPATPVSVIEAALPMVDLVLVMSVNPGFGGQKFIPTALDKIKRLAEIREQDALDFVIQVDGGIHSGTIGDARSAGAHCFVAGSAVFDSKDRAKALEDLRKAL